MTVLVRELNLSTYNLAQLAALRTRYMEYRAKLVPGRQQGLIEQTTARIETIEAAYRARKAKLTADAHEVAEQACLLTMPGTYGELVAAGHGVTVS